VEVAHEALIRGWLRLRKWIDADRTGLRTRTRLTEATRATGKTPIAIPPGSCKGMGGLRL
jgi:hypothetical protein